jgi:hypothetical protein
LTEKILVAEPPTSTEQKRITLVQGAARLIDASWRALRRPWPLIVSGVTVLLLVISARILPQLPGQLSSDPAMAARWLLGASAEYGVLGDILRTLGLFNVLHSFLLQVVLAVISLILFVHLGDLLAALWRYRRLASLLHEPATGLGVPITSPAPQPVYRLRQASNQPPESLAEQVRNELTARFGQVLIANVALPAAAASSIAASAQVDEPPDTSTVETRLLAMRYAVWSNLRPLLILGLLVALVAVWLIVTVGWELAPIVLAPDDTYRFTPYSLELTYQIEHQSEQVRPSLAARVGATEGSTVVTGPMEMSLDGVDIRAQPGTPALLITTADGEPDLTRVGQSDASSSLGLTFPSPGSEESVVLPKQAIGLRIVRMADQMDTSTDHAFMLEIYQGDSPQPTQRVTIDGNRVETVPIDEQGLALQVMALPGLEVSARYLPGAWLLWIAAALVVVGAIGFWFRPAFVLAQIAPWPAERAVVVAQSDVRSEIAALQEWLSRSDE